jgi:hypothetical protein
MSLEKFHVISVVSKKLLLPEVFDRGNPPIPTIYQQRQIKRTCAIIKKQGKCQQLESKFACKPPFVTKVSTFGGRWTRFLGTRLMAVRTVPSSPELFSHVAPCIMIHGSNILKVATSLDKMSGNEATPQHGGQKQQVD